jgi:hypothetical protein
LFVSDTKSHAALHQRFHLIRATAYLGFISLALTVTTIFPWWEARIITAWLLILVSSGLALWELSRYYRIRASRWAWLSKREYNRIRYKAREQYKIRWWITAVFLLNVLANTLVNRPAWPPATMVDWLQSTLILIAVAALLFQLADTWFLRRHPARQPVSDAKETQKINHG